MNTHYNFFDKLLLNKFVELQRRHIVVVVDTPMMKIISKLTKSFDLVFISKNSLSYKKYVIEVTRRMGKSEHIAICKKYIEIIRQIGNCAVIDTKTGKLITIWDLIDESWAKEIADIVRTGNVVGTFNRSGKSIEIQNHILKDFIELYKSKHSLLFRKVYNFLNKIGDQPISDLDKVLDCDFIPSCKRSEFTTLRRIVDKWQSMSSSECDSLVNYRWGIALDNYDTLSVIVCDITYMKNEVDINKLKTKKELLVRNISSCKHLVKTVDLVLENKDTGVGCVVTLTPECAINFINLFDDNLLYDDNVEIKPKNYMYELYQPIHR